MGHRSHDRQLRRLLLRHNGEHLPIYTPISLGEQSVTTLVSARDLDARDLKALHDLVRFGVMADDQIARRYPDPLHALLRIPQLKDGGIVFRWREPLAGSRVYSPTNLARHILRVPGLHPHTTSASHLSHDVAVVDLADVLLARDSDARWVTEDEVRTVLDQVGPPPTRLPGEPVHRPDGLLLAQGQRVGIELEHSDKFEMRYLRISKWFVREWRLDRVRWYVDQPRVGERLRLVNAEHGFDRDIPIDIEPFPPGVALRRRLGKFDP
jgi:hypothetical protein